MGTVDLRKFEGDQIVIHFGGHLTSVDAYTFANSLISLADTIRAVNDTVNPGQSIEIRLDSVAPGSFKAIIKRVKKGIGGFFSKAPDNLAWILIALLIESIIDGGQTIEVLDDHVIITNGSDRVIVTKDAFEQVENVRNNPRIRRGIQKTFEAVERDDAIENFGLTPSVTDEVPLVQIPRDKFAILANPPEVTQDGSRRRPQDVDAVVIVLKPWVDASRHKWSFEWNGVPISAYVSDSEFLARIKRHEISFGNGDAIKAKIHYFQDFDENLGVWVNDVNSFEVTEVQKYLPKDGEQQELQ